MGRFFRSKAAKAVNASIQDLDTRQLSSSKNEMRSQFNHQTSIATRPSACNTIHREQCGSWRFLFHQEANRGWITMSNHESSDSTQQGQSLILVGYLTPQQLAQELGVSKRTLSRWHFRRLGPPRVAIGRKRYYRVHSVSTWLATHERFEPRGGQQRDYRVSRSRSSPALPNRNHVGALVATSGRDD
jgi:hypothetical protein